MGKKEKQNVDWWGKLESLTRTVFYGRIAGGRKGKVSSQSYFFYYFIRQKNSTNITMMITFGIFSRSRFVVFTGRKSGRFLIRKYIVAWCIPLVHQTCNKIVQSYLDSVHNQAHTHTNINIIERHIRRQRERERLWDTVGRSGRWALLVRGGSGEYGEKSTVGQSTLVYSRRKTIPLTSSRVVDARLLSIVIYGWIHPQNKGIINFFPKG